MSEREEQRHVAVDFLLFQSFGCPDALPGGCELDEHPLARDPLLLVERDQAPRLVDRSVGIERKPRVDLGRHAPGDVLEDAHAELHEERVHRRGHVAARLADRLFDQGLVARVLGGGEEEGGVGGRVLRLPLRHRVDVAGVGYHQRVLLEGLELRGHGAIIASANRHDKS